MPKKVLSNRSEIKRIFNRVQSPVSNTSLISMINKNHYGKIHCMALLMVTEWDSELVAYWLGITMDDLNYVTSGSGQLGILQREQVVLLMDLYNRGYKILGSYGKVNIWLRKRSKELGNEMLVSCLNTSSGIRFVQTELLQQRYQESIYCYV